MMEVVMRHILKITDGLQVGIMAVCGWLIWKECREGIRRPGATASAIYTPRQCHHHPYIPTFLDSSAQSRHPAANTSHRDPKTSHLDRSKSHIRKSTEH